MEDKNINKYISETGYCSRREADRLIEQKRVTINGKVATLGNRVAAKDVVKVDGKVLKNKTKIVYLALNKPRGVTCTTDLKDKTNIVDFLRYPTRIFPIGRLDKDSDGLLFLTNDGDIVNKILRAGNAHEKEYVVKVNRPITPSFIQKMGDGVEILDTVTQKCKVKQESKFVFRITLKQGLNRQIRRMAEALGYEVEKLTRVRIMHITLDKIPLGKWRYFTPKEIETMQKMLANSTNDSAASELEEE